MMKITLILLLLVPMWVTHAQPSFPKDGKYLNDKEMVYAIEIFNEGTAIKFFLREDEKDRTADFKTFNTGKIVKIKERYFVQRLDGPKFSKRPQKELRLQFEGQQVSFATYKLLNNFYDTFTIYSDDLHYEYQSN